MRIAVELQRIWSMENEKNVLTGSNRQQINRRQSKLQVFTPLTTKAINFDYLIMGRSEPQQNVQFWPKGVQETCNLKFIQILETFTFYMFSKMMFNSTFRVTKSLRSL